MAATEYTATDAAEKIGCERTSVIKKAKELGIGRQVGSVGKHGAKSGGMWLFSAADLKKLTKAITPRPRKR